MRYFVGLIMVIVLAISCIQPLKTLKINYKVKEDKGHKMLFGVINRSLIANDTAFGWFKENMKYGQPDAAAVNAFKQKKEKFSLLVFGGTWCEDTQNLLPKFYQLIDASGFPESEINLLAVDRKKETVKNFHFIYKITNVPTFIVLKNGIEVGRVKEYGTKGDITKELGEIVAGIK